jgi:NCAIR mutase (PurE)-related protein
MGNSQDDSIRRLAERLSSGRLTVDEFVASILPQSSRRLEAATVDLDRPRRCGFPEVVFGEGKTVDALRAIFGVLLERGVEVLATRIDRERAGALRDTFPAMSYNELARTVRILPDRDCASKSGKRAGKVAVITAGTSDRAVAEEARETLDWMGVDVTMIPSERRGGIRRLPRYQRPDQRGVRGQLRRRRRPLIDAQ